MSQDNFNVVQSDTLYDECLIAKKIYGRCKQQDCLKPICGPMNATSNAMQYGLL